MPGKLLSRLQLVFVSFSHLTEKSQPACWGGEHWQGLSLAGASQPSRTMGPRQGSSLVPTKARLQGTCRSRFSFHRGAGKWQGAWAGSEVCVSGTEHQPGFSSVGGSGKVPLVRARQRLLTEGPALGSFSETTVRAQHIVTHDLSCVAMT